ncbi:MAG TPA: cupredoxin domain-containing protein [Anaerolineae bacterium]|nr:cupredoxin domain-containing protein [Anaerolineae bacterium]
MRIRLLPAVAILLLALVITSCGAPQPAQQASIQVIPAARKAAAPELPAVVIYSQPPKPGGELIPSSWREPGGSASDRAVWENFGFENPQTISEVRWRGGYDPAKAGSGGPVQDFTVGIYSSIPAGSEPNLAIAPLVHYRVGGKAGETRSEVLGEVQTYEYRFELPEPFEAARATTYWVQIEAFQAGEPDWGLLAGGGTLGDGRHFRGTAAGYFYQLVLEDAAIELLAPVKDGIAPLAEVGASLEEIAAMMANLPPPEEVPVSADGIQEVVLVVSRSGYTPIHFAVKAGVPVRLTFRQLGYVPGGNELLVRWGEDRETYLILASPTDKKVLDFTPLEPGEYRFSCPHDWYEGVMTVRE